MEGRYGIKEELSLKGITSGISKTSLKYGSAAVKYGKTAKTAAIKYGKTAGSAAFKYGGTGGKFLFKNSGKLAVTGLAAASLGAFGSDAKNTVTGAVGSAVGSAFSAVGDVLDKAGITDTVTKYIIFVVIGFVVLMFFGILIKLVFTKLISGSKKIEYPQT